MEKNFTSVFNGKIIKSSFWDWCGMEYLIEKYKNQYNISENDAYKKFWEEIKNYNPQKYNKILEKYDNDLEKAIGDGSMDELRNDYLLELDFCELPIFEVETNLSDSEIIERYKYKIKMDNETKIESLETKIKKYKELVSELEELYDDIKFSLSKDNKEERD